MVDDPLAAFRDRPAVPPPAPVAKPPAAKEKEEYVAFEAKDKPFRLRIRSAMAPTYWPAYHLLYSLTCDETYYTSFSLIYNIMVVNVRGKNLRKMIHALGNHHAEFIQEFDADRWEKPTDASAAIIESIEIVINESNMPRDTMSQD